jgi:hypothetical protein
MCKSTSSDQIQIDLIQAEGEILRSVIHKLPDQWKEFTILPIYKKGGKTDCSNYRRMSHLSAS